MRALTLLLAAALWCGMAHAQVPHMLNYQGFLTDIAGQPINTTQPMVFKLYTAASGGTLLYTETQTVAVNSGIFSVVLGAVAPLNLAFDVPYYLGVSVGVDPEMTPRQLVTASPYALRSANADALAPAASVAGAQITGAITSATLPAGNLAGPIVTAQIATNAVTQAKLSPLSGAAAGKVLGTDGANLQWQTANAGTVTSVGTGAGLTGGPITGSGTIAIDPASSALTGNFFRQGGNSFGATAVLGTTGNDAVEINVNNQRALRIEPNATSPNIALGNQVNVAGGAGIAGATVAGGNSNTASGGYSSVGGGFNNSATSSYAIIGGGTANFADAGWSTIAGGASNVASNTYATVGGGKSNTASGAGAFVGGGGISSCGGVCVATGPNNATGAGSAILGGLGNTASGTNATVGGGQNNVASGQNASVPGGLSNRATGAYSFAAGRRAVTTVAGVPHQGAFVWADSQDADFTSNGDDTVNIRAAGGIYLSPGTDVKGVLSFGSQTRQMLNLNGTTWGIGVQSSTQYYRTGNFFGWYLNGVHSDSALDAGSGGAILMALYPAANPPGALPTVTGIARAQTFVSTSDRNAKRDFAPVDTKALLDKVVALPIATWHFKNDGGTRHIGPVAQDFRRLFDVGSDDLGIATVDAEGVALAAIQGLHFKLEEKDAQLARQQAQIDALQDSMAQLQLALRAMTVAQERGRHTRASMP